MEVEEDEGGEVELGEGVAGGTKNCLKDIWEGGAWTETEMKEVQEGDIQDTKEEHPTQARRRSEMRRRWRKEEKLLLQSQLLNLPILPPASLSIQSTQLQLKIFLPKCSLLSALDRPMLPQLLLHRSTRPLHLSRPPPLSQIPLPQSALLFLLTSSPSLHPIFILSLSPPTQPLPPPPPPPILLTLFSGHLARTCHRRLRKSPPMQSPCRRLRRT